MTTVAPMIVCVDDDPTIARALARSLRREHLRPMSTTEPEEALEWVLENDVAVLVADYSMPGMNGVELATRVRELRPLTVRNLLTGHVTADTAVSGINQGGVFRFIEKPFETAALIGVLREAIAHHDELVAVAAERAQVVRRARMADELEIRYPTLTTPAWSLDGAYVVRRNPAAVLAGLGLDALLALRRRAGST